MTLNAKKIQGTKTPLEPLEIGSYPGWLSSMVYVGQQERRPYMGEEKPPADEMFITYELADEFLKDEDGHDDETKPRTLFENFYLFNLSVDNAKSTKRYYAFDPGDEHDGEWEKLLGTPCMITLVHNKSKDGKRIYENVSTVSTLRKKEVDKLRDPVLPLKFFNVYEPDMEIWETLPPFLQEKALACIDLDDSTRALLSNKEETKKDVLDGDEIPF